MTTTTTPPAAALDQLQKGRLQHILVTALHEAPWNARSDYGPMAELEASIRKEGILNPLLARQVQHQKDAYEVFCGHRRLRAARAVGLESVPVIVRPCGDQEARSLAVIDNLQREGLGPMDEARAFDELKKLGLTAAEIAARCVPERAAGVAYVHTRLALQAPGGHRQAGPQGGGEGHEDRRASEAQGQAPGRVMCSSRCRRASPGRCCCECQGAEHGEDAPVRQLPGPWSFFTFENMVPDDAASTPPRVSVEREGVLLVPGTRCDADGHETSGWIVAELETRRRLAWGLTQDEALARARGRR